VGLMHFQPEHIEPFMPFGLGATFSTATACSFAYVGFDAVANAAEECSNPRRDLPIGIAASLAIFAMLYITFAVALCGVVPFQQLGPEYTKTPVSFAFDPGHANVPWVASVVRWGAFFGVLTALITGTYCQARMYLSIARDGLWFSAFTRINDTFGTPINATLWCCGLMAVMAVLFPGERLLNMLNIGVLSSYSIVCSSVLTLRADNPKAAVLGGFGVITIVIVAGGLQSAGYLDEVWAMLLAGVAILVSWVPVLPFMRSYSMPENTFACPLCPYVPLIGLTLNGYMLSQCHREAWARFGTVTFVMILIYAIRAKWLMTRSGDVRYDLMK